MRSMRRRLLVVALVAAGLGVATPAGADQGVARDYVVVYRSGASVQEGEAAIADAGGQIVSENAEIGVAQVRSVDADFAEKAAAEGALEGAASNRPIGKVPPDAVKKRDAVERPEGGGGLGRSDRNHR